MNKDFTVTFHHVIYKLVALLEVSFYVLSRTIKQWNTFVRKMLVKVRKVQPTLG